MPQFRVICNFGQHNLQIRRDLLRVLVRGRQGFCVLQQNRVLVILGQLLESGLCLLARKRGRKKRVRSDPQVMPDRAPGPLNKPQEKKVAECQDASAEQQFRADSKVSHALPSDCVFLSILRGAQVKASPSLKAALQASVDLKHLDALVGGRFVDVADGAGVWATNATAAASSSRLLGMLA